jgi:hypothetical protein
MVNADKIKNDYLQLLQLIEKEASINTSIGVYLSYLNNHKDKFTDQSNVKYKQELKEFLIGANRYSDEFSFSDQNGAQIRALTNDLYELLNRS